MPGRQRRMRSRRRVQRVLRRLPRRRVRACRKAVRGRRSLHRRRRLRRRRLHQRPDLRGPRKSWGVRSGASPADAGSRFGQGGDLSQPRSRAAARRDVLRARAGPSRERRQPGAGRLSHPVARRRGPGDAAARKTVRIDQLRATKGQATAEAQPARDPGDQEELSRRRCRPHPGVRRLRVRRRHDDHPDEGAPTRAPARSSRQRGGPRTAAPACPPRSRAGADRPW